MLPRECTTEEGSSRRTGPGVKRAAVEAVDDVVWTDDAPYLTCTRQWDVIGHGRGYVLRLLEVPIIFGAAPRAPGTRTTLRTIACPVGPHWHTRLLRLIGAPCTLYLTSQRERKSHAEQLKDLSRAPQIDWWRLLEEFAARVLAAEADGQPAVFLHDVRPTTEPIHFVVNGLELTRQHTNMLFGASDTLKSWETLHILGELARRGCLSPCSIGNSMRTPTPADYGVSTAAILHRFCICRAASRCVLQFDRIQFRRQRPTVAGNRDLALLRAMFNWAVLGGLVPATPFKVGRSRRSSSRARNRGRGGCSRAKRNGCCSRRRPA